VKGVYESVCESLSLCVCVCVYIYIIYKYLPQRWDIGLPSLFVSYELLFSEMAQDERILISVSRVREEEPLPALSPSPGGVHDITEGPYMHLITKVSS